MRCRQYFRVVLRDRSRKCALYNSIERFRTMKECAVNSSLMLFKTSRGSAFMIVKHVVQTHALAQTMIV